MDLSFIKTRRIYGGDFDVLGKAKTAAMTLGALIERYPEQVAACYVWPVSVGPDPDFTRVPCVLEELTPRVCMSWIAVPDAVPLETSNATDWIVGLLLANPANPLDLTMVFTTVRVLFRTSDTEGFELLGSLTMNAPNCPIYYMARARIQSAPDAGKADLMLLSCTDADLFLDDVLSNYLEKH